MYEKSSLDFTDFGRLIWKYRVHILLSALLAGIMGIVISFLLPVYFLSTATVYPAAITYVESTDLVYRQGNINELGDTEQAEQILEMLSSQDFKNKIIQKASLFDHYEINTNATSAWHKIHKKYQELIQADRTRFNAVNVKVKDRNPEKAAEIVNLILDELDAFRHQIIGSRIRSHYNTLQHSRDSLQQVMNRWTDSLLQLQAMGVVSKDERAALLETSGNIRGNNADIQQRIDANLQKGAQYDIVERNVIFVQSQISTMDKIRLQLQSNLSPGTEQQFVFEKGHVPDKKHSPKRMYVVLGTIGFCVLMVIFYLFLRENWSELRKRLEG